MRSVLVIAAVGMLTGCGQASPFFKCPHPEFSAHDYQMAALDAVGNMDTSARSAADIARVDAEVVKLRPWVAKMGDVCMRDAANHWLDRFGEWVRDSWRREQEYRSGQAQRDGEEMAQEHRQQELLSAMKLPPKPE